MAMPLIVAALVSDPCLPVKTRGNPLASNRMQYSERPLVHN